MGSGNVARLIVVGEEDSGIAVSAGENSRGKRILPERSCECLTNGR
jgi:hypothetical protein